MPVAKLPPRKIRANFKPDFPVHVNRKWSERVVWLSLPGTGAHSDLIYGTKPTENSVSRTVRTFGRAAEVGVNGFGINHGQAARPLNNNSSYTILCFAAPVAEARRSHVFLQGTENSPYPQYLLAMNTDFNGGAQSGRFAMLEYDNAWKFRSQSTGAHIDGQAHTFCISRSGPNAQAYVDGNPVATTVGGENSTHFATNHSLIIGGSDISSSRYANYPIYLVAVIDGSITPDEAKSIGVAPFRALLEPRSKPSFFFFAGTSTTPVTSDATVQWDITGSVTSDLNAQWNSLNAALSDIDMRWNVANSVTSDSSLQWNSLNGVISDSEIQWNALSATVSDISLVWNIQSSITAVTSDIDARWNITSSVVSDGSLRWNLLSQVLSDSDLRWNILNAVQSDAALQWSMLQAMQSDLGVQWDIVASGLSAVTSDIGIRWNVISATQSDITLQWSIQSDTTQTVGVVPITGYVSINPLTGYVGVVKIS